MSKNKEIRRRLSSVSLDVNTLSVGETYPWNLLWRTVLLWVSFFTSAGAESVRPPTLLDIRDRLNCSMEETTYQFTVQAAGGLAGCIISGVLADRLSGSQTYMFLFISCVGHALPTLVFTFHSSVLTMCINAFIFGFFVGTFHTSANVLLLDIWRGRKSSPYMYTHIYYTNYYKIFSICTR